MQLWFLHFAPSHAGGLYIKFLKGVDAYGNFVLGGDGNRR